MDGISCCCAHCALYKCTLGRDQIINVYNESVHMNGRVYYIHHQIFKHLFEGFFVLNSKHMKMDSCGSDCVDYEQVQV